MTTTMLNNQIIRHMMNYINKIASEICSIRQWKENLSTRQVTMDECMIPKCEQYTPVKPTKWCINIWALANNTTWYICYIHVYTGIIVDYKDSLVQILSRNVKKELILLDRDTICLLTIYFLLQKLFQDQFNNVNTACT